MREAVLRWHSGTASGLCILTSVTTEPAPQFLHAELWEVVSFGLAC